MATKHLLFARQSIPKQCRARPRLGILSFNRGLASGSSDSTARPELDAVDAQPISSSNKPQDGSDAEFSSLGVSGPTESQIAAYDPVARSRGRERQLPPSRYHFRPPRYYRGPLHPHQPPPKSDPSSREFVPGPFSLPRLVQTYNSILAADIMTLNYQHIPPGTVLPEPAPRLRGWDDSSPYHKNRPLRGPRGSSSLPLLRKTINFNNVPTLSKITVHTLVREAPNNSAYLHVAGMVLQALSAQRATVHKATSSSAAGQRTTFKQVARKPISVSVNIEGEQMWHFLSTLTSVVLPRIKEWPGVKGKATDRSGNIQIGLTPETVGGWPEIAINYDAYPPHMIPGIDIVLHTTAGVDKDARLLLSALGLPFTSGGRR